MTARWITATTSVACSLLVIAGLAAAQTPSASGDGDTFSTNTGTAPVNGSASPTVQSCQEAFDAAQHQLVQERNEIDASHQKEEKACNSKQSCIQASRKKYIEELQPVFKQAADAEGAVLYLPCRGRVRRRWRAKGIAKCRRDAVDRRGHRERAGVDAAGQRHLSERAAELGSVVAAAAHRRRLARCAADLDRAGPSDDARHSPDRAAAADRRRFSECAAGLDPAAGEGALDPGCPSDRVADLVPTGAAVDRGRFREHAANLDPTDVVAAAAHRRCLARSAAGLERSRAAADDNRGKGRAAVIRAAAPKRHHRREPAADGPGAGSAAGAGREG